MTEEINRTGLLNELIFSQQILAGHNQQEEPPQNLHSYAIANGAGSGEIIVNLFAYEPEHRNLYNNDEAEDLEEASPWLIKLNSQEPFTQWLLEECFNKRLLLFMQSTEEIDTLAEHFRNYTKIEYPEDDGGNTIAYFSFYDPSTFATWARSLTRDEAYHFFHLLHNVWYEEKDKLALFYMRNNGWKQIDYHLQSEQDRMPSVEGEPTNVPYVSA